MTATFSARRRPTDLYLLPRLCSSSKATTSAHPVASVDGGDIIDRVASLSSFAAHLAQIHALLLSSGLHRSPFLAANSCFQPPDHTDSLTPPQFFDQYRSGNNHQDYEEPSCLCFITSRMVHVLVGIIGERYDAESMRVHSYTMSVMLRYTMEVVPPMRNVTARCNNR
ncbi:hypothetical protein BHM03_00044520 [Ensete ventricosum]|nr:hypothetical protein BHM03_00044520 [Ensete ventricosum]